MTDATDGAPPPPNPREAVADALMLLANGYLANTDDFIAALSRHGFQVEAKPAWRPIGTCPTDGTRVWVWSKRLGVIQSSRREKTGGSFGIGDAGFFLQHQPTHWQPIVKPEGPK